MEVTTVNASRGVENRGREGIDANDRCIIHPVTTGGNWSLVPLGSWRAGSVSDAPSPHQSVVPLLTQTPATFKAQIPTALCSGDKLPCPRSTPALLNQQTGVQEAKPWRHGVPGAEDKPG